jgi:hypothetical protein
LRHKSKVENPRIFIIFIGRGELIAFYGDWNLPCNNWDLVLAASNFLSRNFFIETTLPNSLRSLKVTAFEFRIKRKFRFALYIEGGTEEFATLLQCAKSF